MSLQNVTSNRLLELTTAWMSAAPNEAEAPDYTDSEVIETSDGADSGLADNPFTEMVPDSGNLVGE